MTPQRLETNVLLHERIVHLVRRLLAVLAYRPRVADVAGGPPRRAEGRQAGPLRLRRRRVEQGGRLGLRRRRRLRAERRHAPPHGLHVRTCRVAHLVESIYSPLVGHLRKRGRILCYFRSFRQRPHVHVLRSPAYCRPRGRAGVGTRQVAIRSHQGAEVPHAGTLFISIGDVVDARSRGIRTLVYPILPGHRAVLAGGPIGCAPDHFRFHSHSRVGAGVSGRVGRERLMMFSHRAVVSGVPCSRFL